MRKCPNLKMISGKVNNPDKHELAKKQELNQFFERIIFSLSKLIGYHVKSY